MKTIDDIFGEAPDITVILKHVKKYWAHIHIDKDPELLSEHIALVNSYFRKLVLAHGVEPILNRLINDIVAGYEHTDVMTDLLKQMFVHVIVFHDFGKVNENFQVTRMKNTAFSVVNQAAFHPSHGHSFLGTFIFLSYHIDLIAKTDLTDREKVPLLGYAFHLGYSILQHHSPTLNDAISQEYLNLFSGVVPLLKKYLYEYGVMPDEALLNEVFADMAGIWEREEEISTGITSFSLYALVRLNFSLLTAADYLATHEYMNGPVDDLGVFNERTRIDEFIQHFRNYKHNKACFRDMDSYVCTFPEERSADNLNKLRQEMAVQVIRTVRSNADKFLFYLEAPTGGGKTNLSFIAVTELLSANKELNKVFYVLPFTTLITQTFRSAREAFGFNSYELVELHSKASPSGRGKEEKNDGLFGNEKQDYIDNLFALFPFAILSHVSFFDIIKTNRKERNYLLHRLANSVVVVDELQSYNPTIWDKMLYFISQFAAAFNIRFILMSATLPKISSLDVGLTQRPDFVELLPDARKYLTNKNFSGRVTFSDEFLKGTMTMEALVAAVISKSDEYIGSNDGVKTIIEFIYKRSAAEFYQMISTMRHPFDKIFILSGTILESRRREIINFIKLMAHQKINILLITTQVVEAGVDIDMDLGFKNVSLIDSDEQLAGRVNRNAMKEGCVVYLFNYDDPGVIYGKDYRYKQTREGITRQEHLGILQKKDFGKLYDKVLKAIDKDNKLAYKDNFPGYESHIHNLRFNKADREFQIIDQESSSVFGRYLSRLGWMAVKKVVRMMFL
ncbi:MAG TPA: CRISPR-associated helicase Cas3' [Chitinophaga sp.]|uniref:CRISPR-associated helicase Cas3' n=1 Tax=Chitinophaga sp. TaxID=1869181 RepID=UPI002CFD77B4|nr:CRISPR-associated helicase Cas3' [Chitinophaga sp.]HVI45187.1 CRISPR-associated helicase Cas3' [Chitinophaga sp.]